MISSNGMICSPVSAASYFTAPVAPSVFSGIGAPVVSAVSVKVNVWPSPSSVVLVRSFLPNGALTSFGSTVTSALYSFVITPPVTAALSVPSPLSVTTTVTSIGSLTVHPVLSL